VPKVQDKRKEAMVKLGSGSIAQRGKSIAKERGKQIEIRKTFKMLKEIWLNIRVKKLDTYEGVIILCYILEI